MQWRWRTMGQRASMLREAVHCEFGADADRVQADPDMLRQVLRNLTVIPGSPGGPPMFFQCPLLPVKAY